MLTRLPENHELMKEMAKKEYQLEAGYSGELDIDRILQEIEFPRNTIILKNVKLQINPQYTTQIDTLILTPTRAIILEIKKYAGTIQFDERAGKTIKILSEGVVDTFDCIIHQLLRAKEGLRQWMANRNIALPIDEILVMANPKKIIEAFPKSVPLKFVKQLPRYIKELPELETLFSAKAINLLAYQIKNAPIMWRHLPICEQYNLHPNVLRKGVLCLSCNGVMNRSQGRKWCCERCDKYENGELEQSLHDWFLLIKPTITNKECREFLQLQSKFAASRLLRKSSLHRKGKPPATHYTWK